MTKPKPKSELKAYRGKQSFLTEEQIAVLSKGSGHTQLQTNADIVHMIGKLEQQVQYLEKQTDFLKKIFMSENLRAVPHKSSLKTKNSAL